MVEEAIDGIPIAVVDYIVAIWAIDIVFQFESIISGERSLRGIFGVVVEGEQNQQLSLLHQLTHH